MLPSQHRFRPHRHQRQLRPGPDGVSDPAAETVLANKKTHHREHREHRGRQKKKIPITKARKGETTKKKRESGKCLPISLFLLSNVFFRAFVLSCFRDWYSWLASSVFSVVRF